jgi:hypothetical protein
MEIFYRRSGVSISYSGQTLIPAYGNNKLSTSTNPQKLRIRIYNAAASLSVGVFCALIIYL